MSRDAAPGPHRSVGYTDGARLTYACDVLFLPYFINLRRKREVATASLARMSASISP